MTSTEETRLDIWSIVCTRDGHPNIDCSFESHCESCTYAVDKIMSLLSHHTQRARVEELKRAKLAIWHLDSIRYIDKRLAYLSPTKYSTNKEEDKDE